MRYTVDPLALCRRGVARLRGHLERILAAACNPSCSACAQVRLLARQGLEQPPLDEWQT